MRTTLYALILILFISCSKTNSDQLSVKGLKEPVEIIRDEWGVNHIYAENQHDLFFAQGYAAAKDRLVSGLTQAGFAVVPCSGTWFVTLDLAASGLPADDAALAERLIRKAGVASIPVSAFYAEAPERGYLRLCFAKQTATLDEAIQRLARFRAAST